MPDTATPEQQVLAAEAQRTRALLAADIPALERLTGEEYTHVETGGVLRDKAGFLAAMARPDVRFTSWVTEENRIRLYGDTAVVTGRYYNTVRTAAGEQPRKYARHLRVWVRRNGAWQNIAHQATQLVAAPPG